MTPIADPRAFPLAAHGAAPNAARWHACADRALSAATGEESGVADGQLRRELVAALLARDTETIKSALDTAPSAVVHRHVLRALREAWSDPVIDRDAALVAHGFAIPAVIVAAADSATELPAVIDDAGALARILREHRCLGGNESFVLANALTGSSGVGIESLGRWLAWREAKDAALRDTEPSPIPVVGGAHQGAHLRFIAGFALAMPGANLLRDDSVGPWGMPFARELSQQLAAPGVQLLALPRAPADPVGALQQGQIAHREIALQLFASHAIRTLRAAHGEPTAVVSAHRVNGIGELRLSLSSVYGERDAEGFRCPLFPFDRIDDVLSAIVALLRECRIDDIRIIAGVHGDREAATGLPLFFRADAIERGESIPFH